MAAIRPRSKRFADRAERELRRETLIAPDAALGLVAMDGPNDPQPSLVVEDGVVVELDGRARDDFDVTRLLPRPTTALDLDAAAECAGAGRHRARPADGRRRRPARGAGAPLARPDAGAAGAGGGAARPGRDDVRAQALRARRQPANQAHVTNLKENPALLAADAAEAALRGFAEVETTVGVARYAPLNALAILVGAQTGRGRRA